MNLTATISIYGGGPGSGCNPEVGKCGRPVTGEVGWLRPNGKFEFFDNGRDTHAEWAEHNEHTTQFELQRAGWVRKAWYGQYQAQKLTDTTTDAIEKDIITDLSEIRKQRYPDIIIETSDGRYTIPADDFIEDYHGDLRTAMSRTKVNRAFRKL